MTRFTVLVAAPESRSAVQAAAVRAAATIEGVTSIAASPEVVDLAELGPELLAPSPSRQVTEALAQVEESDVVLVASPQAHGSYTGLLKVFADRLPELALAHAIAVPMAAVDDLRNHRNLEEDLRVLLSDLGAWVIEPGLLLSYGELAQPHGVIDAWAEVAAPALREAIAVAA
ncbi:NADPH-dependent FMN reductase [Salinactinospora qingdaonensis]|uniref:NAD(P)H-dependent oxidoreductase n=1 Tax=Salinactinospora qingdaonensis TaxID=702744 RepID=A0ABP7FMP2_9ACTN